MKLKFDNPEETYELLYVNLGGRGIRDMTAVSDGILVVAGPVGDGPGSYQLYHWDGRDTVPGKNLDEGEIGQLHLLGEFNPPRDGKAEGIVVLGEGSGSYELIVLYDGVSAGGGKRFRAAMP
jgi:hypothetical protein